ncbi:MAG TPA: hypothetical protein VGN68_06475 [Sphingopyxis sp.]|uniref:hypothetical protein n=1 Tax=Sphingopyxis sp. TaxID=1908224 RepID=UPI002E1271B0|nr:hypothetical protein [Sphingopyxis sp.]
MNDLFAGLPSPEDVGKWERASAELGEKIKELSDRKLRVDELIERAKLIFSPDPSRQVETISPSVVDSEPPKSSDGARMPKGIWMSSILEVARAKPDGLSYEDVRSQLPERLQNQIVRGNNKAFYGSMRRLERDGLVVRYNGHLFTPEGYERFKKSPEHGSLTAQGGAKRGSPIGDAIKAFLEKNGPSKALQIKEHLCLTPEFRSPLLRNSSALYNVLKRLSDRNEIIHDKENALFSVADENEAPNDKVAGASEAGEVGASPNENRSLFRLIG